MPDPITALTRFAILVLFVLVVFWPRIGIWSRLAELLRLTERVRTEDALKALYHEEYEGRVGSVDSIAGVLSISRSRAAGIVRRLEESGLTATTPEGVKLTPTGTDYALRILRAHRLLERYLADRTGAGPMDWHDVAERREHALSEEAAEELAARLGHPLYDPHGDPIPTAAGTIPPKRGVPLTALEAGQTARVLHVEDEPSDVYAELVRRGVAPEMPLEVVRRTATSVVFLCGGEEIDIPPVVAANVTVLLQPGLDVPDHPSETLAELDVGESAHVLRLARGCRGPARRRLLDLGLVPGTRVTAEMRSASGDPVAYRIRGALIGLRREQAEWVRIERLEEPDDARKVS